MKKRITLIIMTIAMIFALAACGTIESGYTGVKVIDGIVQDEIMPEGRTGILGLRTNVIIVNNKRQNYTYGVLISGESDDQTVVSAQGISITYQINRDASLWMVKNMGNDFQKQILPDAKIASAVKNAMANIRTENCTNRSYIEPATKQEIQKAIDEYYYPGAVNIIDVSISQMDYEDSYNAQIAQISALKKQAEAEKINNQMKIDAAKAEAEAETTRAEAAKKTAEANAEVELIKSRSYADTKEIEASADIQRIKDIGNVLTDEYLEFLKYQQWDGKLPTHTNGETYISIDDGHSERGKNE